jgi:hypothetical protein
MTEAAADQLADRIEALEAEIAGLRRVEGLQFISIFIAAILGAWFGELTWRLIQ